MLPVVCAPGVITNKINASLKINNKVNRYRFFYLLRHHRCCKMQPPVRCSNHRCVYIDQCGKARTGSERKVKNIFFYFSVSDHYHYYNDPYQFSRSFFPILARGLFQKLLEKALQFLSISIAFRCWCSQVIRRTLPSWHVW